MAAVHAEVEANRLAETQDAYDGILPERLDPATVRRLSELRPWVSSGHIALEWLLIVAAGFVGTRVGTRHWYPFVYLAYPIVVAFIGARQHALIVLAHDAAHYRLFRNRKLNDWVGEVLLAWPFVLFTMQSYRRNHFPHHRHVNTERDPDWVRKQTPEWNFPKTRSEIARLVLTYATGLGFIKFFIVASKLPRTKGDQADPEQRAFRWARIGFNLAVVSAITALHGWREYLLFWVVPYVTWMQLCFQVRSIAEHFAIGRGQGVFAQTRTVLTTWFDQMFVLSKNVNYHLEHHLYPSVPFYRLPELHRLLMERPNYREGAHITRGYLGVLRECTRTD